MKGMVKWWLKYVGFICFFGTCINLLFLGVPVYLMVVYDRVLFSFSQETLYSLSAGLGITLGFMGILVFLRSRLLKNAGTGLEQEMTEPVVAAMHRLSSGNTEEIYTRGLDDLALLKDAVGSAGFLSLIDAPWVILFFVLLFFMHPLIALTAFCGFVIAAMFYLLVRLIGRNRYARADAVASAGQEFIRETLENADLVSGMGFLGTLTDAFRAKQTAAAKMDLTAESFIAGTSGVVTFISTAATAGVYGVGAYLFFDDQITAGIMLAAVLVTARLFIPLERNLDGMKQSLLAVAAYKRLKLYCRTAVEPPTLDLPRPEGRLSVEGVVLAAQGNRLLKNINFALEPGESLGIIGPSGAGKSLLLKLILGIWVPTAGKIRLDGAETAQWNQADLGQYTGFVPQRTDLFSGRVDQNIARFRTVESEQVIKAAKKAFVHQMILRLPGGYNTLVGKAGPPLSAGQVRRISIARALYNDPALVVLDRPNADLDEMGMNALRQTINVLKNEKTTLVMVTEHPNFLMNMDKLLFLRDGQVAMFGPAKEVLTQLRNRQPGQQE